MSNRESDNAITFSFDRNTKVDLDALQNAINTEAGISDEPAPTAVEAKADDEPTVEVETTQTDETEITSTQQAAPVKSESQPVEVKTHKIVVDGQELEVTEADLKSGHMRHRDYTQKTQTLAAEQKRLESERQAWQQEIEKRDRELAQIDEFLKNQAAVDAYRARAFGQPAPSQMPVIDPNTQPTAQQMADIARYNAEQVRLATARELAQIRQEVQTQKQQAIDSQNAVARERLEGQIVSHIGVLLEKYPVLKKLDDIEDILIADASKHGARSLDEAKTRLNEAAERRYVAIRSVADEEKKQAAIKAAEVKRKSPEPPGGTAPRPQPGKKLSLDTKDQKALRAAAEADLRAFMDQG